MAKRYNFHFLGSNPIGITHNFLQKIHCKIFSQKYTIHSIHYIRMHTSSILPSLKISRSWQSEYAGILYYHPDKILGCIAYIRKLRHYTQCKIILVSCRYCPLPDSHLGKLCTDFLKILSNLHQYIIHRF